MLQTTKKTTFFVVVIVVVVVAVVSSHTEVNTKAHKPTPKKTVVINAHWLGKTANSDRDRDKVPLEEKWVRDTFGDEFANALMASTKAFMEVPVGDYKKSHLVNHSNLIVPGAPKIKFQQEEGMDVCVPNALASVLFVLGFHEQATQIYEFGLANMINGPVAGALDKVGQLA